MRNILIGYCIAPYRVDFFNYLYNKFDCDIYFQHQYLDVNSFDIKVLYDKCDYTPNFISFRKIGGRNIAVGLRKIIKQKQPEYIFVSEFSIITIQILLLKYIFRYKYKVISRCDDSFDMVKGNDFSWQHRLARKLISPLLDNIIVVDDRVCEWYKTHFKKGVWMPIIVDDSVARIKYESVLSLSNRLNEQYGLSGKKVILFVGRLVDVKNVATLITAYSQIKDLAKLVIIGKGIEEENLKKIDERLCTDAIFLGQKVGDELLAWYNIADIFVLPSILEPFGAVTNEALIAGCYSLISERAGSASIIKPGVNGEIFTPTDENQLAELLKKRLGMIDKGAVIKLKDNLMQYDFKTLMAQVVREIRL